MRGQGHVIVLLAVVVCLALVLGFLSFKNGRERTFNPSASLLCNGRLSKDFEFSKGDYIKYKTVGETHFGAMSLRYPKLQVGKITNSYYEIIIGNHLGGKEERIVLVGTSFIEEGKYGENESLFFRNLSGEWKLIEEHDNLLKYEYGEKSLTYNRDSEYKAENLAVLIEKDTGIPIGAYWFSTDVETGASTHHYLYVENTNIQDIKDGINEYKNSDIFMR